MNKLKPIMEPNMQKTDFLCKSEVPESLTKVAPYGGSNAALVRTETRAIWLCHMHHGKPSVTFDHQFNQGELL